MKHFIKQLSVALGIGIILFGISLAVFKLIKGEFPENPFQILLVDLIYSVPLYLSNRYLYDYLTPKLKNSFDISALLIRIVAGIAVSALVSFFVVLGNYAVFGVYPMDALQSSKFYLHLQQPIWIASSISVFFNVYYFILMRQKHIAKTSKSAYETIYTQHEALKTQIGPHFLFNSLNVLSGLIEEQPHKAQEFVQELSSVYRYVLEKKEERLVPLREELNFARRYLQLMNMRFESSIRCSFPKLSDDNEYLIVPLSLQLILENCIKHNAFSDKHPLEITMEIDENYLKIRNKISPKNSIEKGTQKGVKNIIQRYGEITPMEVKIEKSQHEYSIALPLLTSKNIHMKTQEQISEMEYFEAKKTVERKQKFYWGLATYMVVNAFLVTLNLIQGGYFWAIWPILGWGIGILLSAVKAFGWFNRPDWQEQQIQKELEKIRREKQKILS